MKKNGAPMKAVMMPRGISTVEASRAMVSTSRRKAAPIDIDAHMRRTWSGPTSFRARWGTTRPIQPMLPLTDTEVEVSRVAQAIMSHRYRRTLTPSMRASSSPMARTLSFQL